MPNYHNSPLHIWTKVGDELFEATKIRISCFITQQHLRSELADEAFVNTVFELWEQVSEAQAQLLGAALILFSGGSAQVHVSIGGGGSQPDLPWSENKIKR